MTLRSSALGQAVRLCHRVVRAIGVVSSLIAPACVRCFVASRALKTAADSRLRARPDLMRLAKNIFFQIKQRGGVQFIAGTWRSSTTRSTRFLIETR
jgi:hypothetical protein